MPQPKGDEDRQKQQEEAAFEGCCEPSRAELLILDDSIVQKICACQILMVSHKTKRAEACLRRVRPVYLLSRSDRAAQAFNVYCGKAGGLTSAMSSITRTT